MHARIRRIRHRLRSRRLLQLHRFTRDDQGLQLVEAAIVIPVFLLLFAATAEFGRFFYEYTTLAKAVRGGSRYLSAVPFDGGAKDKAQNIVVYGSSVDTGTPILAGLEKSDVEITYTGSPTMPDTVTVEITGYTYQPIFDLGLLTKSESLSLNIKVSPSVTMRFLGPPLPLE